MLWAGKLLRKLNFFPILSELVSSVMILTGEIGAGDKALRYGSSSELSLVAIPGVNNDRRRMGMGMDWTELDLSVLPKVLSGTPSSKLAVLAPSCLAPS